ncbi:TonB-dependent receptor, partial [Phenylobacterium sp.]|uniref:TonB-dependent receptor n=1 Tax=Phenylobacterium sp. TaxID=1871053 RepID=UPI0037846E60
MTYGLNKRCLLGGVALLALIGAAPAMAQTQAAGGVLEEVVVTATRQEQVLSRVPVSVAAYTQESMDAQGVRQIDDVARLTPGLTFTRSNYGTGQQTDISIRGISAGIGGSASTTGVYIDDTPIQVRAVGFTATNPFPKVFDLARVEVLRGPQGTLFGAGAMGGTVRFIAPEADVNDYSGYARAELASIKGGETSGEFGAAVGGPIVQDKIGFRLSGWYRRDGGWIDRASYPGGALDKNVNTAGSTVLRGAMTFRPTERLEIVPSFYYQKTTIDDTAVIWENLSDRGQGRFVSGNQLPEWNRDFFSLGAVAVRYDFGPVALESNTSLFVRKNASQWDYTDDIGSIFFGTPYPQLIMGGYQVRATMINRQESFTQEVRLRTTDPNSRLRWVAGVFYNHADQDSEQWDYDPMFPQMIETLYGAPVSVIIGPTARGDQPYDLVNINRG